MFLLKITDADKLFERGFCPKLVAPAHAKIRTNEKQVSWSAKSAANSNIWANYRPAA